MLLYLQENMRQVKVTKWDFELMPEGDDAEPDAVPAATA